MWVVGVSSLSTLDCSYRASFTWNYKRSSTIIWVLQEFIFTRCYNYILLPSFQRTFNTLLYFNLHLRFAQQFQVCQINLKGTPLKICLEFSGIIFLSTFHWPALPKLVHANIMYIRNVLLSICTHQCGWWWPTHSTWIVFIHTHTLACTCIYGYMLTMENGKNRNLFDFQLLLFSLLLFAIFCEHVARFLFWLQMSESLGERTYVSGVTVCRMGVPLKGQSASAMGGGGQNLWLLARDTLWRGTLLTGELHSKDEQHQR